MYDDIVKNFMSYYLLFYLSIKECVIRVVFFVVTFFVVTFFVKV